MARTPNHFDPMDANGNGDVPSPRPPLAPADALYWTLQGLASLRLTVILFAFTIVLVFVGTLAQVELGIWTAVEQYFRSFFVWVPFRLAYHIPGCRWILPEPSEIPGAFPFPGGWLLGSALLINLLAAHAVRFKLSWKRSGVLILHFGLIVIMVGELVTGLFAVESTMTIAEGETVEFLDVNGKHEIALTDTSDPRSDSVIVVPQRFLHGTERLKNSLLPVDLQVVEYHKNSFTVLDEINLDGRKLIGTTKTADGKDFPIYEAAEISGVDPNQRHDFPAMRVKLYRKGADEVLGEYLLSLWFYPNMVRRQVPFPDQTVKVGEKTYKVELRPERVYQPFKIRLIDFKHETYVGTTKPKNFSSRVQLIDPERNENREIEIYMNTPLRYRGLTFYQSGFLPGNDGTVLQVVRNPAWLLPYFSCGIVAIGMLIHFGIMLRGWVKVQQARAMSPVRFDPATGKARAVLRYAADETNRSLMAMVIPLAGVLLAAIYLAYFCIPPSVPDDAMNLPAAGRLPITAGGRAKPLDTLARNTLLILSERQEFIDNEGKRQPAIRFLLDLMSLNGKAREAKVFRIENEQVRSILGLEGRDGYRYALEEFESRLPILREQIDLAQARDAKKRNVYDVQILKLAAQIKVYEQIETRKEPHVFTTLKVSDDSWISFDNVQERARKRLIRDWFALRFGAGREIGDMSQDEFKKVVESKAFQDYIQSQAFRDAQFEAVAQVLDREGDTPLQKYISMLTAYRESNATRFNLAVDSYRTVLEGKLPEDTLKAVRFEAFFNHVEPFYRLIPLSVVAFLLACLSWMGWSQVLNRAAFWLLVLVFGVYLAAIVGRMYITGLPPITNLYSTAIFIGGAAVAAGLILEACFRNGFGSAAGALIAFCTLLIAHFLGADGDTMETLEAVLRTPFWLWTHVTVINLGYCASFLVGAFGLAYLAFGVFVPGSQGTLKSINSMMYGSLCFAIITSFVGTVLGGIWADQSWGRFWGWDPKENGALLVVLWNALIIHARWGGIVKARGVAILAVFGCIITAWSYFGTNLLGVGLHAYGFKQGTEVSLVVVSLALAALGSIGFIPTRHWLGLRTVTPSGSG